ncbi:MAG TPA: carboxypeptidase-like regulatory domain-containing protein, partial [Candidatus Paceibacterota bacterium]|nr:carboxypeptidase-like regulatory domain-containing protein [Candidatus Paceibacterota bacterium]
TLQIIVVDALGGPVAGAEVHIENPSTVPAVDLTTFTNAEGLVYLPGALPSTDYRIETTKSGYSTATTYARDATNQNPTPGYLTVVENQTTTGTFAIDLLADLTLRTFSPPQTLSFADTFADLSQIAEAVNVGVSAGALALVDSGMGYPGSGHAVSVAVTPTALHEWGELNATLNPSASTEALIQVVDASGAVLPNAVLPGNEAGFDTFPVSLAGIATSTYPTLKLRANLTSTASAETPELRDWSLSYRRGATPLPNIAFTLRGAKTVGSTGAGAALYKTTVADSTNGSGVKALSLEWDAYELTLNGYDVVEACPSPGYALAPGSATDSSLYLGANTTNMLLVTVKDNTGAVVPGADVTLSRTGFSQTVETTSCGTAYFGNLTSSSAYTVSIAKAGYTTANFANVNVAGHIFYVATFE